MEFLIIGIAFLIAITIIVVVFRVDAVKQRRKRQEDPTAGWEVIHSRKGDEWVIPPGVQFEDLNLELDD